MLKGGIQALRASSSASVGGLHYISRYSIGTLIEVIAEETKSRYFETFVIFQFKLSF